MAAELRRLPGPYEILDLPDRGSVTLRVRSYERGLMTIHPRYEGGPEEKEIPVLRLHLQEGVKPYPPAYYDVTSKTLQSQLIPMLAATGFDVYEYVITKFGEAPRARFTVERRPIR